jgi:hypothetical protein
MAALVFVGFGLSPALPRLLSGGERRAGICRITSVNAVWPRFLEYATQREPSPHPRYEVVSSTSVLPEGRAVQTASGKPATFGVTFAGQLRPEKSAWFVLRIVSSGPAALYLDGLNRLEVDDPEGSGTMQEARLFLSNSPHELLVRYMSSREERHLRVLMSLPGEPLTPLDPWLSTSPCGPSS